MEAYCFDRKFFAIDYDVPEWEAGGIAIFRLVADGKPDKYLHIFNNHTGYYSHGFEMKVEGEVVREGSL